LGIPTLTNNRSIADNDAIYKSIDTFTTLEVKNGIVVENLKSWKRWGYGTRIEACFP